MILALATSGSTTELWLRPDGPHVEWESGRRLADELLGRITELCKTQQQTINDLSGIVILSGPGSFTSLRIGHTVANALADSLNIPIVGATGDDWLAEGLRRLPETKPGQPVWPFYGAEANVTKPKA
jgi:tRNA threonylcarbamoyl adenosine modification protein YeaZ